MVVLCNVSSNMLYVGGDCLIVLCWRLSGSMRWQHFGDDNVACLL